jgi:hypothetical protein
VKLETAGNISSASVTEDDIRKALDDDTGRGEFIILSDSDQVYIQAGGEGSGPFSLEFRTGDADHHFQCLREVSKQEVEAAFLKYLKRDASLKDDLPWQKMENRPWWKLW